MPCTRQISSFDITRNLFISRLEALARTTPLPPLRGPEQRVDMKNVDTRAEIYSAGKILQALVIRSAPTDDQVLPGLFKSVIRGAIEHNPVRRYATSAEMLGALLDFPQRLLAKVLIVSVGNGARRSNGVIESHTLKDTDSPRQLRHSGLNCTIYTTDGRRS